MDVSEYLRRIKSEHLTQVSIDNLFQLHKNHVTTLSFENINIALERKIPLDLDKAYNKIIRQGRGGFCFELNRLYAWLLVQLGYKVRLVQARAFQKLAQEYTPLQVHVAPLIEIDDKCVISDVGFSTIFAQPIELKTGIIQQTDMAFYQYTETEPQVYELTRAATLDENNSLEWTRIYKIDASIYPNDSDFQYPLDWVQSKECQRFYNRTICVRPIVDSVIMITGYNFTKMVFANSLLVSREDKKLTAEEIREAIRTQFGIKLDSDDFLPRNIELE